MYRLEWRQKGDKAKRSEQFETVEEVNANLRHLHQLPTVVKEDIRVYSLTNVPLLLGVDGLYVKLYTG